MATRRSRRPLADPAPARAVPAAGPRRQVRPRRLAGPAARVLKVSEVAAILRVGRNQLYEAVARGELRAVRIGRTIRIPKMSLLDLTAPPAQAKRDRLTQVTPW